MGWRKLGRVFVAEGHRPWAMSHAYVPTVHPLDGNRLRVYAAFLDRDQVGRVGFVDVDAADPLRVLEVSGHPALDIGSPGSFDQHGVTPMCALFHQGVLRLYYTGWRREKEIRYTLFTGLAESRDGGTRFERWGTAPVLGPVNGERMLRSAACVLAQGDRFRMWYASGDQWIQVGGKTVPTYHLRHMESSDGFEWGGAGVVCLEPARPDEYGFGRPFVVREANRFRMWYSIRSVGRGYRLGYAESPDGLSWERRDAAVGLEVSPDGWDSEMIAFACVQNTAHGLYLFYNGNGYGKTGFGVAVWEG